MKKQHFWLSVASMSVVFLFTLPSAFPGGGSRVGNGMQVNDSKKASGVDAAPEATPVASAAPTATPKPKDKESPVLK